MQSDGGWYNPGGRVGLGGIILKILKSLKRVLIVIVVIVLSPVVILLFEAAKGYTIGFISSSVVPKEMRVTDDNVYFQFENSKFLCDSLP